MLIEHASEENIHGYWVYLNVKFFPHMFAELV